MRNVLKSIVLVIFLANQLPVMIVDSASDSSNQCSCLTDVCKCNHTSGSKHCHASQKSGATGVCYTAANHHETSLPMVLIVGQKPFLLIIKNINIPLYKKDIDYWNASFKYIDVILPCPDKPPRFRIG